MPCGMPASTRERSFSERGRETAILSQVRSPTSWLWVNSRWACHRSLCGGSSTGGAPVIWLHPGSEPSQREQKREENVPLSTLHSSPVCSDGQGGSSHTESTAHSQPPGRSSHSLLSGRNTQADPSPQSSPRSRSHVSTLQRLKRLPVPKFNQLQIRQGT